jgi:hypothetical protein
MNLFYLDHDLDKCAEYHIDKHVGKMQLEAAQLMTTTLWVDKYLGFIPRKLTSEELGVINEHKRNEPSIDNRVFTRYLPTHINHPCAIWARSSLEHHYWIACYVNALNSETVYRGNKPHASCDEVNRMPEPLNLPDKGWSKPALAMPDELKSDDVIASYRKFYMLDKGPFASWKVRGKPDWWDDELVAKQAGRISGRP